MASKGKPSPRSAVSPLSDEQVKRLAVRHTLVDSTQYYPTGPRTPNQPEINAQNPKATKRLLGGSNIILPIFLPFLLKIRSGYIIQPLL